MKNEVKSPFLVYQDFLSHNMCDKILENIKINSPDKDSDGRPMKRESFDDESENIIFNKIQELIPEIESHFDMEYEGTERIKFQHFPEGMPGNAEDPKCQNARYLRKKWVKIKDVDFTAILWLKDFQSKTPIDLREEVYGGKLEFPAYDFSLVPQRGTLVLFPAGPHFISAISPILVGDLYQARINICAKGDWLYQPDGFKGDYVSWFEKFA